MMKSRRYTQILESLLRYKRLTRGELGRLLGLSPGAIVRYVKPLIESGIIRESASVQSEGAGRKAVYLEFDPDGGLVLALSLHRTSIQSGLVSTTGDIIERREYPYSEESQRPELIAALVAIALETLSCPSARGRRFLGVGVSMGGHVDAARGLSQEYLFARDWYAVPLRDILAERLGLPVYLIKDTRACCLGEQSYGRAIGVDDFISVWMGTGLGMGLVSGGHSYSGASGHAGELGHTRGGDPGRLCYCGRSGCLEGSVSQGYILARCREGIEAGVLSSLSRLDPGPEVPSIAQAIAAAAEGDRLACGVFAEVGELMGLALCDLANLLNPSLIVLRGPVIDANRFLFETIERKVKTMSLRETSMALRLEYAQRDEGMQLKGLCSLVLGGCIRDLEESSLAVEA